MTDYYINPTHPNASDSNAGTDPTEPWLTLNKMNGVVTYNDTVTLAGGARFVEKWHPAPAAFVGTIDSTTAGLIIKVDTTGTLWSDQLGPASIVKPDADFDSDSLQYIQSLNFTDSSAAPDMVQLTFQDIRFIQADCYHLHWIEQSSSFRFNLQMDRCRYISPNFVNPGFFTFLVDHNNGAADLVVTMNDCHVQGVYGWGTSGAPSTGKAAVFAQNCTFRGQWDPAGWLVSGGRYYGVANTHDGMGLEWQRTNITSELWDAFGCVFIGGMYNMVNPNASAPKWDAKGTNLFLAYRDLFPNGVPLPGNAGGEVFARVELDLALAEGGFLPGSANNRFDFVGSQTGVALTPSETPASGTYPAISWPDADILGRDRVAPVLRDAGAIEGAACGTALISGSLATVSGSVVTGAGQANVGATVLVTYISGSTGDVTPSREPVELTTDDEGLWSVQAFKGATYHVRIFDVSTRRWESRTVLIGTADAQLYEQLADV